MSKNNGHDLVNKCCAKENKNLNSVSQQAEQLNVQQRYHKEFLKYQEQINKVQVVSPRDDQAA